MVITMVFYALILDIICIVTFVVIVVTAFRSGFLRSIVLLGGYVLSWIVASATGKFVATFVYNSFVNEKITKAITDGLRNATDGGVPMVEALTESLPQYVANLINMDNGIVDKFKTIIESGAQDVGTQVAQTIVAPIVISFLQVIFCSIIFFICVGIVSLAASVFSRICRIPIIGMVNSLLGGLLGVVQGGIVLYIISLIGHMVISFTNNNFEYFNSTIIGMTYIYKLFHNLKFI